MELNDVRIFVPKRKNTIQTVLSQRCKSTICGGTGVAAYMNMYDAEVYIGILQRHMWTFQQDNTRGHSARAPRARLCTYSLTYLPADKRRIRQQR